MVLSNSATVNLVLHDVDGIAVSLSPVDCPEHCNEDVELDLEIEGDFGRTSSEFESTSPQPCEGCLTNLDFDWRAVGLVGEVVEREEQPRGEAELDLVQLSNSAIRFLLALSDVDGGFIA